MPNKFNFADFGMQAAQDVVGAGLGLALGSINDKRQLKQQGKLQRLQIQGQKEMTSYNQAAQYKMWQDTNYKAQMQQLKMAGLNPAMIYGMSGGGGTTASVPQGNVTGAHAPTGGGEAVAMGGQMMQLGLMRAQKENIEADTANKKADIPVKGATVPKIEAETKSITQGIENQKAAKELMDIQVGIQSVEEHIAKMTQNQAVAKIGTELRYITAQMHIWERNNNIDAATADEKIELMEQQVIETGARILLTKAQTGATQTGQAKDKATIDNMAKQIALGYAELANEKDKTELQKKLVNFETSFGKQAADVLKSVLGTAMDVRGRKSTTTHTGGAKNETIHRRE